MRLYQGHKACTSDYDRARSILAEFNPNLAIVCLHRIDRVQDRGIFGWPFDRVKILILLKNRVPSLNWKDRVVQILHDMTSAKYSIDFNQGC